MYLEHFGLTRAPFGLTPQTQFYFPTERSQQTLLAALGAIERGEGIIKITGEVGTGKTLMCRMLLAELQDKVALAYLAIPASHPSALFAALLHELGGHCEAHEEPQAALQRHLLAITATGKQAVLVVDESQAYGREGLEALRLLSNLETENNKLITIVLFGQPELDEILAEHSLRQLRQRITFSFQTGPLSFRESVDYLRFRLEHASESRLRALSIFTLPALYLTARAARGIPRLLNITADKALLNAFGRNAARVDRHDVHAALDEHNLTGPSRTAHWVVLAILLVVAALLLLGIVQNNSPQPVITNW